MAAPKKNASALKQNSLRPLIIDPRSFYNKHIKEENGHFADTTEKALQKIQDEEEEISAIFMIVQPDTVKIIKNSHLHRPNTPLFLFYENELPFSEEELNRLAIESTFNESLDQQKIIENMNAKVIPLFQVDHNKKNIQKKDLKNQDYFAVKSEQFLHSCRSFFDVYIKMEDQRFLKILNAMDVMPSERTQSYIQKGIRYFYIPKKSYQACLSYCDTFSYTLLSNKNVSFGYKTNTTLHSAQNILSHIKEDGLKEEFFEPLENFLIMLNQLLAQMDTTKEKSLHQFVSSTLLFEKAVSTATIASLLVKPLQITSSRVYHQLGYAALLHDISLTKMDEVIQTEDLSKMNEKQKDKYFQHPELSAKELKKFNFFDESTIQAIAQHHERKNNSGFPHKTAPDRITRLAEVIGICDEFVNLMYSEKANPTQNNTWEFLKKEMTEKIYPGFSAEMVQIFHSTFFKEPTTPSSSGL